MGYSVYPNQLDSSDQLPIATDAVTPVKAEVVNRLRDAVLAIEAELGVQPSSTFTTLSDRLNAIDSTIATGLAALKLSIKDEGTELSSDVTSINFVGAGITTTLIGPKSIEVSVTATGSGGGGTLEETLILGNTTDGNDIIVSSGDGLIINGPSGYLSFGSSPATSGNIRSTAEFSWRAGTTNTEIIRRALGFSDYAVFFGSSTEVYTYLKAGTGQIEIDDDLGYITLTPTNQIRFDGYVNVQNNTLTNIPTPTEPGDAVNKAYADAIASGALSLTQVLAIGNTTSGQDIELTSGDLLTGAGNISITGTISGGQSFDATRSSADTSATLFSLRKTRPASAKIESGDDVGAINFQGWDSATYQTVGRLEAIVSGTTSAGNIPTTIKLRVGNSTAGLGTILEGSYNGNTKLISQSNSNVHVDVDPAGYIFLHANDSDGYIMHLGGKTQQIVFDATDLGIDHGLHSSLHENTGTGALIVLQKSRGTFSIPDGVQDSDEIGDIVFSAYSSYAGGYDIPAMIATSVYAPPNSGNIPTRLSVNVGWGFGSLRPAIAADGYGVAFYTQPSSWNSSDQALFVGDTNVAPTAIDANGSFLWSAGSSELTTHRLNTTQYTTRGTISPVKTVEVDGYTDNATPTNITLLAAPSGITRIAVIVVGRDQIDGYGATFQLNASVLNDGIGGLDFFSGSSLTDSSPHTLTGATTWDAELTSSGTNIVVRVTGETSTAIDWGITAEYTTFNG